MGLQSKISCEQEQAAGQPLDVQIRAVFGNRYQPVKLLPEASRANTVVAIECQTGETVVIKTVPLHGLTAGARIRLEHEQTAFHDAQMDHIAPVREIGQGRDCWHFVRSHIDGISLKSRLCESPLNLTEALSVARCLMTALQGLHARGGLHGNIKPSNLILQRRNGLDVATLIDGGLNDIGQPDKTIEGQNDRGTLYLSPEQAGLIDRDLTTTSDLYSAGLVLFECLAGRPPFEENTTGLVLLQHMTAKVPRLRSFVPELPRAIDDLIQHLLCKDPRDRYQSAEAVLADLDQILSALESGDRDPSIVIGRRDRRKTLTSPAFVSRRSELSKLCNYLSLTRNGQGGLIFLEGKSGQGKTRLLAELGQHGMEESFRVFRCQAQNQVGQKPLQLLEGLVQEIVAASKSEPEYINRLRRRLGHHSEAVAAALPELASFIERNNKNQLVPEAFGEARTIEALATFLEILGSKDKPALMVLDDCQWADEMMVRLISRWNARRQAEIGEPHYVMIVVGIRSDQMELDDPLYKLTPTAHMTLSAFDSDEIRQLVESMSGPLPQEAMDLVVRLSDGSPFMASAMLYGLIESGSLVADEQGWRVEPFAISKLQSSSSAASVLLRRIELLHPNTIEFLSIGALLGKEFELGITASLTNQTSSEVIAALEEARQRNLIWVRPSESHAVFVHDRLRESFLDRLKPDERRELHSRAAFYLKDHASDRVFDLAYHFDAAGDSNRALDYALAAANQARAVHSLEVAEQQYRIAERGSAQSGNDVKYTIAIGLGECLMLRGRYVDAAPEFEKAAGLAEGSLARAQATCKLGELSFKRGEMEAATRSFEAALRQLGRWVPRNSVTMFIFFLWEAFVQTMHSLIPRLFIARTQKSPSEEELLSYRIFSRLAHGYWFTQSKTHVLWTHLRGMNLAEYYQPTLELAQSYSEHAPAMSLVPLYGRGVAYAKKSLIIRKKLGDLWGQGQSLHYLGVVLYSGSRYRECIEKCREGVRLLERTGDFWEMHTARYQIAAALYRLGDLESAVEQAKRTHESGLALGDYQASGIILDVWARSAPHSIPMETLQKEVNRMRPDAQGTAQVSLAEGARLMANDDYTNAVVAFERALRVAGRAGVMNAYVSPNLAWLATALRTQAQHDHSRTPGLRKRLIRRATRIVSQAICTALRFRNDLPHALREAALVLAMRGVYWPARSLLDMSLYVARRQEANYEYAQTLNVKGQLGKELGWSKAEDDLEQSTVLLCNFSMAADRTKSSGHDAVPITISLADRFAVVLQSGRKIASALSPETVLTEVREAAKRLLRGDHCEVISVRPEDLSRLNDDHTDADQSIKSILMRRALKSGRAVTDAIDSQKHIRDEHLAESKSSLCAPISVRGVAVACLYVSHQEIFDLFGADEERLADFITAIAGAALENADGFFQLQQLNSTLEQRVAERTAAAENASHAKSQFLATMSHEIRTPMNGIIGMTNLALMANPTSQQRSYLTVVKQSADSLLRLLNDILDFSKIEAGRLELEVLPFDLHDTVSDAVRILSVRSAQSDLELNYHVAANVPQLLSGDAGRLRQIIVNLVGNAIKFTPEGEVCLEVTNEAEDENEVVLHFAIRDTGIGISPEQQGRIFESFSQADNSITRRFGGTGLGLSISAQLVQLMNGRIWVESEMGVGSTFHFTSKFTLPPKSTTISSFKAIFASEPVLIVDDHPTSRDVLCDTLEQMGLQPQAVPNADAAMMMLQYSAMANTPFRVAMIDATMPGRDGWALAKQIRSTPSIASCPIVMIVPAGNANPDDDEVNQLPNTWCFTKPAKISEIADAIKEAIGNPTQEEDILVDQPASDLPPMQILLVDDSPVNREVATGLLEMFGHHVDVATNGQEALEMLEKNHFDAVLMDLEMPGMDGMTATRELRNRSNMTPVVAMTAHAIAACRDGCLEAGMDGYLTKPIQPAELMQTLESIQTAGCRPISH